MNHHELHEAIDRTIGRSKLRSTPPVVLIAGDHRSPRCYNIHPEPVRTTRPPNASADWQCHPESSIREGGLMCSNDAHRYVCLYYHFPGYHKQANIGVYRKLSSSRPPPVSFVYQASNWDHLRTLCNSSSEGAMWELQQRTTWKNLMNREFGHRAGWLLWLLWLPL